MKYYRILNDLGYPNRWFLGAINFDGEWDFWEYLKSKAALVPNKELEIALKEEGIPLDFTFADFELPIINEKAAKLLNEESVQLISLSIDKFKSSSQYYLVILKKEIKCVDEENSDFDKWEAGNEIRPDKAGQYSGFYK